MTMGSYDGAEICELVGLFILDMLAKHFPAANVGLYRDDGLAVFKNLTARTADKLRNTFIDIFKSVGLKITVESNLKVVNYLDVTLNLANGRYQPFRKPGNDRLCININSNHPPTVLKHLPSSIAKRVSELSCDENAFHESLGPYERALKESGHSAKLEYQPQNTNSQPKRKNRKRKIIWFNPPYSTNVKTNVGKRFLQLLEKHFPKEHPLHKLFNRNNVKVSYSCMPNFKQTVQRHNLKVTSNKTPDQACNCTQKDNCPVNGDCMKKSVVYQADVTSKGNTMTYIGMTGGAFKLRYNNHLKSFRHDKYQNETELSKHIWKLTRANSGYAIKWSILSVCPTRQTSRNQCSLCIQEKLCILSMRSKCNLLNSRSELISACRHNKIKPSGP